jgi:hypothetical protein
MTTAAPLDDTGEDDTDLTLEIHALITNPAHLDGARAAVATTAASLAAELEGRHVDGEVAGFDQDGRPLVRYTVGAGLDQPAPQLRAVPHPAGRPHFDGDHRFEAQGVSGYEL